MTQSPGRFLRVAFAALALSGACGLLSRAATNKPPLHAKKWLAITGKPLGATAGAMIFQKGGNAVDAAAAMIAATCTMWDTLSWGGETQALIYNPKTGKVVGINALGVAPTGATPEFFRGKGMAHPPEYGPLAAVTPGTPGGIMVMLAEFGKLSLAEVLAPAIDMADGYPVEQQHVSTAKRQRDGLLKWPESRRVLLPRPGDQPPEAGEMFRQPDLAATLRKLVEAEKRALAAGKNRKDAILAAYDRFYRGDIAEEFVRGSREVGGLHTLEDLANWRVHVEEPVKTTLQGHRGLQARRVDPGTRDAPGPEHPRGRRPQGDGVQQLSLHPRDLPGDEPRVRGPRLLLRRPLLPARRADEGASLEGVRGGPDEDDRLGEERSQREAGRSLPVPGGKEPVFGFLRKVEDGPGAPKPRRARSSPERERCAGY